MATYRQGSKVLATVDLYRDRHDKSDRLYRKGDRLIVESVNEGNRGVWWTYWLTGPRGEVGACEGQIEPVEGV